MTAEIAVLNKEAVALSADSASTVWTGAGPKVFNSVSKIFGLTKGEPVGVMLYGQAAFLGVPWETVIRAFRDNRKAQACDTLAGYGTEFIDFIEGWDEMFPADAQEAYVARTIYGYFAYLWERIEEAVTAVWDAQGPLRRSQTKAIAREVIATHHQAWKDATDTGGSLAGSAEEIRTQFAGQIKAARLEVFAKTRIGSGTARYLTEIAGWLFTKQPAVGSHPEVSGVVIAGFGTDEYFPHLVSYEFEGMVFDKVKFTEGEPVRVGRAPDTAMAAVVPFAQHDSVRAFMEGLHPDAGTAIGNEVGRLLTDYPAEVLDNAGVSAQTRTKVLDAFAQQHEAEREKIGKRVSGYLEREHVSPVLDIVGVLPKDELAMMAESLVNLTSFRHRVSFGAETVGGPIDVAVISKGDGFVWIKRKHYFKQELNPQLVAHKYGGTA